VRIIEDASHAIGGGYGRAPVGNCRFSDITVFSFHPVKIVTTGEGGMAMTNDPALAELMRLDRSHGITRDPGQLQHDDVGPWYYEQQRLGFNYRMTDIAAALGLSQLTRIEEFISRRREIAAAYDAAFADLPLTTPWQHPDSYSGLHLYVIRLQLDKIGKTHRQVFEALREHQGDAIRLDAPQRRAPALITERVAVIARRERDDAVARQTNSAEAGKPSQELQDARTQVATLEKQVASLKAQLEARATASVDQPAAAPASSP